MRNPSTLNYPRTGKRGVPQQFPRRLYEMLESEAESSTPDDMNAVITWSGSGKAFHIRDVHEFSSSVLPKYFRTNKFSSFQRNLNLYGFTKLRRGPDSDMYAHPSFIRGEPELLTQLRKCTSASKHRSPKQSVRKSSDSDTLSYRSVSPSPPREDVVAKSVYSGEVIPSHGWMPSPQPSAHLEKPSVLLPKAHGAGRLDLLALAIEHTA
eukprot:Nitzschia sp. Nitz4//scaffold2_size372955//62102//62805//NITZ4_000372-RA/size372955-processed-gene-0.474-mRNA-1//-1//CDS//3329546623//1449//frame0